MTHTDIFALKRIAAFNLAEVLITLGIIGIIAAITLPALINKRQNKVLEAQFKKSYSQLSQVIQSVVMDEYGSIVEIKNDEVTNFVKFYTCSFGFYWRETSLVHGNGYGCTIKALTDPHYFGNL